MHERITYLFINMIADYKLPIIAIKLNYYYKLQLKCLI